MPHPPFARKTGLGRRESAIRRNLPSDTQRRAARARRSVPPSAPAAGRARRTLFPAPRRLAETGRAKPEGKRVACGQVSARETALMRNAQSPMIFAIFSRERERNGDMQKEAKARIRINDLLRRSGWRFFADATGPANVALEANVKLKKAALDALGDDFEKTANGFVDYLLLDERGFPLAVLEAKSEKHDPLVGKEQARRYALSQNARFVILSNGNLHYFWDLEQGNPALITEFPNPESFAHFHAFKPNPDALAREKVETDYVAATQNPHYARDPRWTDAVRRDAFVKETELKFLRPYQLRAIRALQDAVRKGQTRFLFEMATGTGKTLAAAAVIKMFLRTGNAKRVLFLVDRLELETQAWKAFVRLLKNDFRTVIYKENRDDWRKAEIVVSTVQSLQFDNKYRRLFSPTDFDLLVSDEAHRSVGGNSRAVFEYFVGYKLGLTATPKDYLKKIDPARIGERDPREWERRQLLDTYKTFGCESGVPTYRYSLTDGVRDGFLLNPVVVDARTEITTQLLADEGYSVLQENEDGELAEQTFFGKDFEKNFFSDETNRVFCETFLKNALRDPLSGEIGKTIVFCVRQDHATAASRSGRFSPRSSVKSTGSRPGTNCSKKNSPSSFPFTNPTRRTCRSSASSSRRMSPTAASAPSWTRASSGGSRTIRRSHWPISKR